MPGFLRALSFLAIASAAFACATGRGGSTVLLPSERAFTAGLRDEVARAVRDLSDHDRRLLVDCRRRLSAGDRHGSTVLGRLACYPSLRTFRGEIGYWIFDHIRRGEAPTRSESWTIGDVVRETVDATLEEIRTGGFLVFRDVWLWDGTGAPARQYATVVIEDGRIAEVGTSEEVRFPDGARVIEGEGRFLIPGLWDLHVHAVWADGVPEAFFPLFVVHGVTGVRDMGGTLEALERARRDLEAGHLVGPRLIAAGLILDGPEPVHPDESIAVGTPQEARAAVATLADAGADFIKVYTLLPADAFRAVVEEAAVRGLPVAGHVPADVGVVEAARAGMVSFEHLMSELHYLCDPGEPGDCAPVVAALLEHDVAQVPALVMEREQPRERMTADPRLRYLPPVVLDYWFDGTAPTPPESGPPVTLDPPAEALRLAGHLHEAGVPLLPGTDTGVPFVFPGSSLHEELRLLVAAGLTPAEVLAAATREAAALAGRSDLGTIEPGKRADLVLLRGNPLEDVGHTAEIEAVVVDGKLFDRDALDGILADVRARSEAAPPASDR